MKRSEITSLAQEEGFHLTGILSVSSYDKKAEEEYRISNIDRNAKSAILLATGGSAFWNSLSSEEKKGRDPIDRATVRRSQSILFRVKKEDPYAIIVFPFRSTGLRVSFRRMAEMCGMGVPNTVLGILIHPTFGPWVSLRGLIVTRLDLEPDHPLDDFEPCGPCSKPCVAACPAQAVRPECFEFRSCAHHIERSSSCNDGCLARIACVYGTTHTYSGSEAVHRQKVAKEALVRYVAGNS